MPSNTSKNCLHCSLPVIKDEIFCCSGCNFAYKTIHNLGLGSFYKNRILSEKEIYLKPEEKNSENKNDISNFSSKNKYGSFSASFLIKGLHCGACVWLIESILKKQPNVEIARINMSKKRLYLSWKSNKKYGNHLVDIISNIGYKLIPYDYEELQKEEKKYNSNLLKALSVAGFGAGNVMLVSVALWTSDSSKMGIFTHNFLYWLSALIALPVIIYSGRIFFISAFKALKAKTTNMDVPISVAIIITSLVSLVEVINKANHAYFDSAVMLTFFLLIARYLDFLTRKKASNISHNFSLLGAISAVIIDKNGKNKIILARNIKKNMILNIAVGDKIAADGVIISGETEIDSSVITGESMLKKAKKNDEVFAGTINCDAAIRVKVTKNQKDSLMSKIGNLVDNLEHKKSKFVKIADKISSFYTPITHLLAFATILLWYFHFESSFKIALLNSVAVLIITCPCALALAVPIVNIISVSRLLKKGIIIKNGESLERLEKVDTIVFDKTGTLTHGEPVLKSAYIIKNDNITKLNVNNNLFILSASMATNSNHPLAKALAKSFLGKYTNLTIKEIAGSGLKSKFEDKEIKIGKREFVLNKKEIKLLDKISKENVNKNPEIIAKFNNEIAIFSFEDSLKKDAKKVINQLKLMKKQIILLSGDKEEVVKDVANYLGIKQYFSSKNPIEKTNIIQALKLRGAKIAMCGDGINDAPALMASDVALSVAKASDITRNVADIIIQGQKLQPIIEVFSIAKSSNILIKQNLALSFLYNIIAIPFAMMGYVTPFIAAFSMSLSSILVTLNSIRTPKKLLKI